MYILQKTGQLSQQDQTYWCSSWTVIQLNSIKIFIGKKKKNNFENKNNGIIFQNSDLGSIDWMCMIGCLFMRHLWLPEDHQYHIWKLKNVKFSNDIKFIMFVPVLGSWSKQAHMASKWRITMPLNLII